MILELRGAHENCLGTADSFLAVEKELKKLDGYCSEEDLRRKTMLALRVTQEGFEIRWEEY